MWGRSKEVGFMTCSVRILALIESQLSPVQNAPILRASRTQPNSSTDKHVELLIFGAGMITISISISM